MKSRLTLLFIGALIACQTKEVKWVRNKNLIDFSSSTLMDVDQIIESNEKVRSKLYSDEFNSKTDTIKFENGFIYISYLSIVNGCAQYDGDIIIKSDSIILELKNINGVECTEPRCDRLIYKIKNKENKKFKIKKR